MIDSSALPTPGPAALPPAPLAVELARQLIAKRYGFFVNDSWCGQLTAQLAARAAATGCVGIDDYVRKLLQGGQQPELATLVESILNGETHFLRTAPHFTALIEKVVPAWRALPGGLRRLRLASLGCSSGEEPYSLAMVLHENLSPAEMAQVEISGVDVNSRSLDFARAGLYEAFQLREIGPARWQRWFTPEVTRWRIHPALQSSVRFLQHNLMDPLPFAGLDVIFCRNVMIYFDRHRVASCLHEFHVALRPGGFLFLGHAESAFAFPEYFEPVQIPDGVIYQNKASFSPLS
jgi:chemotaxis protein methyltransferase CheR